MTVAIVDGKIKVTLTEAETVMLNIDCVFLIKPLTLPKQHC